MKALADRYIDSFFKKIVFDQQNNDLDQIYLQMGIFGRPQNEDINYHAAVSLDTVDKSVFKLLKETHPYGIASMQKTYKAPLLLECKVDAAKITENKNNQTFWIKAEYKEMQWQLSVVSKTNNTYSCSLLDVWSPTSPVKAILMIYVAIEDTLKVQKVNWDMYPFVTESAPAIISMDGYYDTKNFHKSHKGSLYTTDFQYIHKHVLNNSDGDKVAYLKSLRDKMNLDNNNSYQRQLTPATSVAGLMKNMSMLFYNMLDLFEPNEEDMEDEISLDKLTVSRLELDDKGDRTSFKIMDVAEKIKALNQDEKQQIFDHIKIRFYKNLGLNETYSPTAGADPLSVRDYKPRIINERTSDYDPAKFIAALIRRTQGLWTLSVKKLGKIIGYWATQPYVETYTKFLLTFFWNAVCDPLEKDNVMFDYFSDNSHALTINRSTTLGVTLYGIKPITYTDFRAFINPPVVKILEVIGDEAILNPKRLNVDFPKVTVHSKSKLQVGQIPSHFRLSIPPKVLTLAKKISMINANDETQPQTNTGPPIFWFFQSDSAKPPTMFKHLEKVPSSTTDSDLDVKLITESGKIIGIGTYYAYTLCPPQLLYYAEIRLDKSWNKHVNISLRSAFNSPKTAHTLTLRNGQRASGFPLTFPSTLEELITSLNNTDKNNIEAMPVVPSNLRTDYIFKSREDMSRTISFSRGSKKLYNVLSSVIYNTPILGDVPYSLMLSDSGAALDVYDDMMHRSTLTNDDTVNSTLIHTIQSAWGQRARDKYTTIHPRHQGNYVFVFSSERDNLSEEDVDKYITPTITAIDAREALFQWYDNLGTWELVNKILTVRPQTSDADTPTITTTTTTITTTTTTTTTPTITTTTTTTPTTTTTTTTSAYKDRKVTFAFNRNYYLVFVNVRVEANDFYTGMPYNDETANNGQKVKWIQRAPNPILNNIESRMIGFDSMVDFINYQGRAIQKLARVYTSKDNKRTSFWALLQATQIMKYDVNADEEDAETDPTPLQIKFVVDGLLSNLSGISNLHGSAPQTRALISPKDNTQLLKKLRDALQTYADTRAKYTIPGSSVKRSMKSHHLFMPSGANNLLQLIDNLMDFVASKTGTMKTCTISIAGENDPKDNNVATGKLKTLVVRLSVRATSAPHNETFVSKHFGIFGHKVFYKSTGDTIEVTIINPREFLNITQDGSIDLYNGEATIDRKRISIMAATWPELVMLLKKPEASGKAGPYLPISGGRYAAELLSDSAVLLDEYIFLKRMHLCALDTKGDLEHAGVLLTHPASGSINPFSMYTPNRTLAMASFKAGSRPKVISDITASLDRIVEIGHYLVRPSTKKRKEFTFDEGANLFIGPLLKLLETLRANTDKTKRTNSIYGTTVKFLTTIIIRLITEKSYLFFSERYISIDGVTNELVNDAPKLTKPNALYFKDEDLPTKIQQKRDTVIDYVKQYQPPPPRNVILVVLGDKGYVFVF